MTTGGRRWAERVIQHPPEHVDPAHVHRKIDPLQRRRVLTGLLAWIAFGLSWWLVLRRDPRTWQEQLLVPASSLFLVTAVTLLWVRHNLAIFRRKGPRRGLPVVDAPWTHDSLGRPLALPAQARLARVVEVHVEHSVKRYEVPR